MAESNGFVNMALIGSTGFVGSTLCHQANFSAFYRSSTIDQVAEQRFDCVVCAAAPAQKWIANQEPIADLKNIERLIEHLKTVSCETFVLISTVDVFKTPIGVDEDTFVDESGLHAYGLHRRLLEKFVENHFDNHLIIRLPGLVGPGLRKNVIFDFLNDNNLQLIDARGKFQFYPMVNLWRDINTALSAGLRLVHLTAEPLTVEKVSRQGFGKPFDHTLVNSPARYDMKTKHAQIFAASGPYQYSERETIQAIRAYAQSERRMVKPDPGASA